MFRNTTMDRNNAIREAQDFLAQKPIYLDTETTGLKDNDEIVEIAIIDHDGSILFDELVRPAKKIPFDATRIHGITDSMVASARKWPVIWPLVRIIIISRMTGIYNAEYDVRMMKQSFTNYGLPWKDTLRTFDVIALYSKYYGEWDSRRASYRYQSLKKAGGHFRIPLQNSHRAKDDCLLTRDVLHHIANSKIEE
ncbi:MAG: 3'-5' exonuclease [Anaerolineaceae bacterium]|nr:3'-5' exonuclease [Anaerolineaceae bacterium]